MVPQLVNLLVGSGRSRAEQREMRFRGPAERDVGRFILGWLQQQKLLDRARRVHIF